MTKTEFNLLDEPWILVVKENGTVKELSILDLFKNAHKYRDLAGELPTQNIAILRFLLAILHAVFARYNLKGEYDPIESPDNALKRWKDLWDMERFPTKTLKEYLVHFHERFWLFHPEYPFYQVASLGKATEYTAAKLNGILSQSSNKVRLFPQRTGKSKMTLTYPEAARWLLYVNGFDDTSAKPKQKGLPSPGVGWLGKLGLIAALGNNLFQTLMLNLVMLKNGENELWDGEKPIWEEPVRADERNEITMPNNPSELLTLQSRRLLLRYEEDKVIGFALLGGDFFQRENSLAEQMTSWRNAAKKKDDLPIYNPKRHNPTRQIWRDFPALTAQRSGVRRPGIVNWLATLRSRNLIPLTHYTFKIAAVKYGDKDFFVDDVFSDSISFNVELLTRFGENWVARIIDELNTTDMLVQQLGHLAQNLAKASGDTDGRPYRNNSQEQAYFMLDLPFRSWLSSIDPKENTIDASCDEWWEQARRIIISLGRNLIGQISPKAFVGRTLTERKQERHYNAPEAFNRFLYRTSNREALKGGKRE